MHTGIDWGRFSSELDNDMQLCTLIDDYATSYTAIILHCVIPAIDINLLACMFEIIALTLRLSHVSFFLFLKETLQSRFVNRFSPAVNRVNVAR